MTRINVIGVSGIDAIFVFKINEIVYVEASGRNTFFFLFDGQKIISNRNLAWYDNILKVQGFFRVHQSFLVNLFYVSKIHKDGGDYLEFGIKKMRKLPISRRRNDQLRKELCL